MQEIKVPKGQILQHSGALNSKIYAVKSGLLRSYSIDKKGREHIFMFAPEGWTIADSVKPDLPCDLFIEALEDSQILVFEKKIENSSNIESLINRINVLQKRVIMLMSSSAIERYQHFVETYSDIVQRVPQKMIASYLGVTPESLSAAKKDWYKNQAK
ncbi:Crp/Fnr family transcriptional regulator [Ulvibacterium sp.]|uniref:Crp/Fnr family transcriptional regulator n=1 Tax=Ulvibacterium sp. TaxID=2665914 RepID=UPI003CC5ECFF